MYVSDGASTSQFSLSRLIANVDTECKAFVMCELWHAIKHKRRHVTDVILLPIVSIKRGPRARFIPLVPIVMVRRAPCFRLMPLLVIRCAVALSRCRLRTYQGCDFKIAAIVLVFNNKLVFNHRGGSVSKDVYVVALVKGEERFIFLFNEQRKGELLRTLGKYASNTEINFSWYDAAVLSQKARNATKQPPATVDFPKLNTQQPGHNGFSEFEDFLGEEPIW